MTHNDHNAVSHNARSLARNARTAATYTKARNDVTHSAGHNDVAHGAAHKAHNNVAHSAAHNTRSLGWRRQQANRTGAAMRTECQRQNERFDQHRAHNSGTAVSDNRGTAVAHNRGTPQILGNRTTVCCRTGTSMEMQRAVAIGSIDGEHKLSISEKKMKYHDPMNGH